MKFLKVLGAVSIMGVVVTGCSSLNSQAANVSAAYQQGYDYQSSNNATMIGNYAEAYAYCQTIASTAYSASTTQELNDYVSGCMDYVYSSSASDSSSGSSTSASTGTDASSTSDSGTGVLTRLNDAGYSTWSYDKTNNITSIPVVEVILGSDDSDGSTCAVWVFRDEQTANDEGTNGDFDWVNSYFWYGSDDYGNGAILIADNATDNCAVDAANALNWTLE